MTALISAQELNEATPEDNGQPIDPEAAAILQAHQEKLALEETKAIQTNLERIVTRLGKTSTLWKVKATTYARDVAFLLQFSRALDNTRVQIMQHAADLEDTVMIQAKKLEELEAKLKQFQAPLLVDSRGNAVTAPAEGSTLVAA